MKNVSSRIALLLLAIMIPGCSSVRKPGFPKEAYSQKKQIAQLEQQYAKPELITDYYAAPTKEKRDLIVSGRLALINLNYNKFVGEFCFTKQSLDTTAEMTELGINLATTAVGGAGAKTILGAISSGISGAKLAIDKNFFYERTVPVLVTSMNAQRKEALIPILNGMKETDLDYPLARALSDLDAYYFAGTFLGALQTIQAESGSREKTAEKKIEDIRKPASENQIDDMSFITTQLKAMRDASNKEKALSRAKRILAAQGQDVSGVANLEDALEKLADLREELLKPENRDNIPTVRKLFEAIP